MNAKKTGKKRRVAGWLLVALGVAAAWVWLKSGWTPLERFTPSTNVLVDRGTVRILRSASAVWSSNYPASAESRSGLPSFEWWGDRHGQFDRSLGVVNWHRGPAGWGLRFYLWPLVLIIFTSAVLLLRSASLARRRANIGRCGRCGYNLAGLADGTPCPECGKRAKITA